MNKKLVPVIIAIALLAGGGYYLKTKNNSAPGAPQTTGQAMNEANEFAKAIESGKPTICTMTKGSDVMEYILKGKLMRVNTSTIVTDSSGGTKTMVSHMINDTAFLYMWDDTTKQGSKMSAVIPSATPLASVAPQTAASKFDESDYQGFKDQGYTISCKATSVADSAFTPPTDVNFIDPSEMMRAIPSPGADGQIDMQKIQELQQQYGGAEY